MLKKKIVDALTGEEIILDLTPEEIANVEAAQAEAILKEQENQAKIAARQVILEKLGLTDDEAKLLLS